MERCFRLLLRLYPKAYRDARGAEMLGTLLDAAESGRSRPVGREVAALLLGALRARSGADAARSAGQLWLSACRIAALLLVAHAAAMSAAHAGRVVVSDLLVGGSTVLPSDLGHPAALAAGLLALVAIAAGRYGLGVVLIAVTFAFGQWAGSWQPLPFRTVDGEFWQLPLAALLTLPLLWRRPAAARRPLAWLLAVPLALVLLPTVFDASLRLQPFGLLAVYLGCLAWSVVDARVAVAGSALLLGPILSVLAFQVYGWASEPVLLAGFVLAAAVLVGAGARLIRRQARL